MLGLTGSRFGRHRAITVMPGVARTDQADQPFAHGAGPDDQQIAVGGERAGDLVHEAVEVFEAPPLPGGRRSTPVVARDRVRRLRMFQHNGYLSLDIASGRGDFMRLRDGWRPGVGQELSDIVEMISLEAPAADALSLELHSFVHAVRGDREAVVTGREGRAALALALRVTAALPLRRRAIG